VQKLREVVLAQHRLDDNGRECRCKAFRLRGVELIAEADL
jgi:hypothetical protein